MNNFQPGQIVKHGHGPAAHYAVVVAENRTVGWTSNSSLEVKPIDGFAWEVVAPQGHVFTVDQIKANIREFKAQLAAGRAPQYHLTEFNCEHWATLMVTGVSYSTQAGSAKIGGSQIVGGAMVLVGATAGTVVSFAGMVGATASTGTAIGTLSGVAASNAALAWLGGGSIAAGGGGIAAGSAILGAVSTGGVVLALAGVGIITKQVWDNLDEAQRQELITTVDRATPDQVKVMANATAETIQTLMTEKGQWLGDQSSKLAHAVQTATPPEFKAQLQGWMGKGQDVMMATGEMASHAWEKTQEQASSWWQGAAQQISKRIKN